MVVDGFVGRWGLNPPPYLFEDVRTGRKCLAGCRRDAWRLLGLTRNQAKNYMNNLGRKLDKRVCTHTNKNTDDD